MTRFADRVSRHPLAYDGDLGAEGLSFLPDLAPELRELIAGAAGSSPYLARLIASEAAWLAETLSGAPEPAMEALVEAAGAAEGRAIGAELRGLKRRAALLIALADLGGVWGLQQVTGALTRFAEATTEAALRSALTEQAKRGRLPGITEDDLQDASGMVVLAMGKMGAGELNYSSDIDLICLFDDTRFDPGDVAQARTGFVRATRAMAATLGEQRADGYVFRTDLRLRPDPASTPVCMGITAAERYYEAEGRSWERAAYIKARPVAGDLSVGSDFLAALTPFVWRRHLDFAAIEETQSIRQRIRAHKGLFDDALEGYHVKLGSGGIREIEFFAQTRQLIAGGRDPTLRVRGTVEALGALEVAGWISAEDRTQLATAYSALREVEHRLQMIADAQTHSLPQNAEGFDRLARLSGASDTDRFRAGLVALFEGVRGCATPFFERGGTAPESLPEMSQMAAETVARWPGYPALRSERGQEIFARLKPDLLRRLGAAARPDEALANFDGFLKGLPAGVQLFSLFEANPALVELIVDICATAPGLSRYLSGHAGVLDAVLGGDFFAPWPGLASLCAELGGRLAGLDHEAALDQARIWQKEWHFRVGVHLLRRLIGPEEAAAQYSDLAEAVVAALWPVAQAEVARRHGWPQGASGAVVAMGSLGAGNMAGGSDLDLMVIYDAGGADSSDGDRPLDTRAWFAKATKALVAALSAPTAEGTLYKVDMRLRPSGRQGPVATGLAAFEAYQRDEAWTWEHLALTRARVVAGPGALADRIEAVRSAVLALPRVSQAVRDDTATMRRRLREAGRQGDTLEIKEGPGGLQDITLLAQTGALLASDPARGLAAQLGATVRAGLITAPQEQALVAHAALFEGIRQGVMLLADRPGAGLDDLGEGGRAFLALSAGASDWDTLQSQSARARLDAAAIIDESLPEP